MSEPSVFGVAGIAWLAIVVFLWCVRGDSALPTTRVERMTQRAAAILAVVLPIVMALSLPGELQQNRADQALHDQVWFTTDPPDHR